MMREFEEVLGKYVNLCILRHERSIQDDAKGSVKLRRG